MSNGDSGPYADVWSAIAQSPAEAANLRARAELMTELANLIARRGWTQTEAANHSGISQPRMNDLLRGRISRFSLDALVNIATSLGCNVRLAVEAGRGRAA